MKTLLIFNRTAIEHLDDDWKKLSVELAQKRTLGPAV